MDSREEVEQWGKMEARLRRRWPRLELQDLADLALGQASLVEVLLRRYEGTREEIAAEIAAFENMTPPPDLA
jgi:hypothetical protein